MSLNRRSFLKGSLASVAATSLYAKGDSSFYDTKLIPHATHFGAFNAEVDRNGKIVKIIPHESDKHPNLITDAIIDRVYSDTRVKYPCVRKSFLEGKNSPELRGKEPFVRVSWEKAIDLVLENLKKTPIENLFNASYGGWGHVGKLHNCNSVAGRFFNTALGGHIGTDGEYSNGAAGRVNTTIMGDLEVYSLQTSHEVILENTKVYILWGTDLYKCNQIDYVVANRENDQYYKKYANSDIKFILIDPQFQETGKLLGADWIKIRPNTDVALAMGMMHYLYKSKKYDKNFIETYTDGFDKFLPYLLGKGEDKIEKTPKWAAKITGIDEKIIKSLADTMVSNRTFIAGNWAMQRAEHGEQADWTLIALASMIGQIGLPGGGIGFSMHYAGGGQAFSGGRCPVGLPQGKNKLDTNIPASRISEAILNPGKEINFKGKKLTYPKIDLMYVVGANILGHHPDTNELIKALRTLKCLIVQEPWWTPLAKMADIILPSTTTLERDDISFGGSYSQNWVYAMKKVVDPVYESRNDYDIFEEMAAKISDKAHKKFTGGKTKKEWLEGFINRSDVVNFVSFEEFWDKGSFKFDTPDEAYKFIRHADFRANPVENKLRTESGKIQIYSQKFADYNLPDFKGHPIWIEPSEWLGNQTLTKEYPFHLLSPHPRWRVHSQLDNTWLRNIYKIQGREPIFINTKDAKKLGINHADIVEVYNSRGRLLAGAFVSDHIMEGVVSIQEGAWYDPEDKSDEPRDNAGHVNILTSSRPTSQMAQATSVNTCLVGIKKLENETIKPYKSITPPEIIGA
ncbi:molybdopterin-dependent oxidoreductase [Campylobacter fetus]|uniref:trimethylamine-N-oxide reductase n=1 Tax=Campylobacter fetus subsp. testudinum TaxID=1507806 RepID=A0AAX0HCF6_CAMFE|nr:molybdopterin-dependent oxidoreductase [Campylobacter fetus]AJB45400.1 biotin sulfoxide reductase [Campylobacter fetus subsp. testudinum]ALV64817.1 molybdopterin-containing oxidoreductase I, DMSO/TMAO/BSO reductase family, catalytic subunit [Campylobacter fetus subsp. testudinum Sp3]AVK81066.1 biotin sulfoxide reductase [Campylobacter fetus subsp. testudinum]EAI4321361.1 biotin sulfoxide reductase [Campylobacter fetus]EAK0829898.1 biotin sulfoxide reductase [Campylobacter fetus]